MNPTTKIAEKRDERVEVGRGSGLRITRRDRELLAMMATARYLSSEQIQRLFFSGRTEAACRIRLFQLAGLGKQPQPTPYIRRLRFRSFEGKWFSACPLFHCDGCGLTQRPEISPDGSWAVGGSAVPQHRPRPLPSQHAAVPSQCGAQPTAGCGKQRWARI